MHELPPAATGRQDARSRNLPSVFNLMSVDYPLVSDELPELVVSVRGVEVVRVDEVAKGAPVGDVQEDIGLAEFGADGHVRVEVAGHEIGPGIVSGNKFNFFRFLW